ncbi:hypothetical protein BHM03_00015811 [Ensete ventricosum]|nr:hypothetical protein BHM03_00015811 [Ensete ventricosum]
MNRPTRQPVEEARAGVAEKHLAMVGEKHPTEGGSTLVKPPGRDSGLDRGVARYRVRDAAPVLGEVTLWHFFRGAYRLSRQVCSLGKRTLPCQVTYEFGYWVALEHFRVKYSDLSVEEDPFANWPEDANMQMEFSQPFDDSVTPEDRTSLYFWPSSSLGIGPGSDDAMGHRREFARRFVEGIGKLTGNTLGDHRKKTRRLIVRIPEAIRLTGVGRLNRPYLGF